MVQRSSSLSMARAAPTTIKVGIFGGGTVGGGIVDILDKKSQYFTSLTGHKIEVRKICVRDASKPRDFEVPSHASIVTSYDDILDDPEIDMVVEVMGGTTDAKDVIYGALRKGKNVVTANKALIAAHLPEIEGILDEVNDGKSPEEEVEFRYEAAVCGGIPIIRSLQTDFVGDEITMMSGIINGCTNFMLTAMDRDGKSYDEALARAVAWERTDSAVFWHTPSQRLIEKPKGNGCKWDRGDGVLFVWMDRFVGPPQQGTHRAGSFWQREPKSTKIAASDGKCWSYLALFSAFSHSPLSEQRVLCSRSVRRLRAVIPSAMLVFVSWLSLFVHRAHVALWIRIVLQQVLARVMVGLLALVRVHVVRALLVAGHSRKSVVVPLVLAENELLPHARYKFALLVGLLPIFQPRRLDHGLPGRQVGVGSVEIERPESNLGPLVPVLPGPAERQ